MKMSEATLLPRFIRLKDAPFYLGMDRNRFNAEIRPYLTEIPIGTQGIAFDRLDLDKAADEYKRCNGRPASLKGDELWGEKDRQDSACGAVSGISKSGSMESNFAKAVKRAASQKRKPTSQKG